MSFIRPHQVLMIVQLIGRLRRSVYSNTLSLIGLRAVNTVTRLLVLLIVARIVAPDVFGLIVFALAAVEVVRAIVDFGVDTLCVREFAISDSSSGAGFASVVAWIKLFSGLIGYGVVLSICWLAGGAPQTAVGAVLGLLVISSLWANLSIIYFQARLRADRILLPVVINSLLVLGAAAALVTLRPGLLAIAVLPLGDALNAAVLLRRYRRETGFRLRPVPASAILALLRSTLPIAGTIVLATIYTRLDVVLLQLFLDPASIGYYGVAFRFSEPLQLVAVAFSASVYGHLSSVLASGDRLLLRRQFLRYTGATLAYGLVSAFLMAFLAPPLIVALLPDYQPAVPILRALAAAIVFRTLNGCLTSVIQAYGRFTLVTGAAVWNTVFILVLMILFIPRWGALGAAFALVVVEAVNTLIQAVMVRALMGVSAPTQPHPVKTL